VKWVGLVDEKGLATGSVLVVLRMGRCRTAGVVVDVISFGKVETLSDVATLAVFILMVRNVSPVAWKVRVGSYGGVRSM